MAAKTALKLASATHPSVGKFLRDLRSGVERSARNDNTKGSKLELDMIKLEKEIQEKDSAMMVLETSANAGVNIGSEEIIATGAVAKELEELMKGGKKKLQALRMCCSLK